MSEAIGMDMLEQIANETVQNLLNRWPETADVFHRYGMACVGCAVAPFYSVGDAIDIYNLSRDEFLNEIIKVIGSSGSQGVSE